jgi:hypothetical protein
MPDNLEQRGLDKLNQEKNWIVANKHWLLALVVAFVIGFLLAKAV